MLLAVAVGFFCVRAASAVTNPHFYGDSGHRLHHANELIVFLGSRVWLPVLQFHVWLLHHLGLPYWAFKIVPCLYFLVAAFALADLAHRSLGRTRGALGFALLVEVSFASFGLVGFASVNLYQEIIAIALFFALLAAGCLELRENWRLLSLASVGLLTRETFWVYLAVFTALNLRAISSRGRFLGAFGLLWAIPLGWIAFVLREYVQALDRWPRVPLEWPLMINRSGPAVADLGAAARSLGAAWDAASIGSLGGSVLVVCAARATYCWRARCRFLDPGGFAARFLPFSVLSLLLTYGLLVLFDPYTPGNLRLACPLLEHLLVWVVLLFAQAGSDPRGLRAFSRLVLIGGLVVGATAGRGTFLIHDHSDVRRAYAEITRMAEGAGATPRACIAGEYWTSLTRFVAGTLYMKRTLLKPGKPVPDGLCDVIIADSRTHGSECRSRLDARRVVVAGVPYQLCREDRSRTGLGSSEQESSRSASSILPFP